MALWDQLTAKAAEARANGATEGTPEGREINDAAFRFFGITPPTKTQLMPRSRPLGVQLLDKANMESLSKSVNRSPVLTKKVPPAQGKASKPTPGKGETKFIVSLPMKKSVSAATARAERIDRAAKLLREGKTIAEATRIVFPGSPKPIDI